MPEFPFCAQRFKGFKIHNRLENFHRTTSKQLPMERNMGSFNKDEDAYSGDFTILFWTGL